MTARSRLTETWRLNDAIVGPLIRASHIGKRKSFRKGEYLYHQDDVGSEFYFVLRGHVQITSSREDGSEFVLEVMGQWAVCGEGAAFDGEPRFSSAVAVEDAEVIVFDANSLGDAFRELPELAVALLRISAMKQRILGIRAQYLASPRPEARVAELLFRLANLYGSTDGTGILIDISLTHEQMAAMTGTTRVTVTRVLKRLQKQGAIEVTGRQLKILNIESLKS